MSKNQPTDKQKQEFWELCGLVFKDEVGYHGWYKGLGEFGVSGLEKVYVPDIDSLRFLGFLFKYAVPLLEKKLGYKEAYKLLIRWIAGLMDDKDPADYLFELIFKALGRKE